MGSSELTKYRKSAARKKAVAIIEGALDVLEGGDLDGTRIERGLLLSVAKNLLQGEPTAQLLVLVDDKKSKKRGVK